MAEMDKTFYDRRVVYLDYLERGEKVKNGGFVKWEARGESSRVQIQIRGLYPTDTLRGELMLLAGGRQQEADFVGLQYGMGQYVASWNNRNLADTGISFAECDGILIRLSDNRLLRGQWRESSLPETALTGDLEAAKQPRAESEHAEQGNAEQERTEEAGAERAGGEAAEPIGTESEHAEQGNAEQERTEEAGAERAGGEAAEPIGTESEHAEQGNAEQEHTEEADAEIGGNSNGIRADQPPHDREWRGGNQLQGGEMPAGDKWEQLNRLFPKIRPFGDGREYLSLTPRDFVVLERHWHAMVQNSFLLHGYYNYGHVVLVRIEKQGEEHFYLGVPGVYFEREKQAALMFGFEGFEAADEEAVDGGFGYYMKQVEI